MMRKQLLKRQTYHRFWGLRVHTNPQPFNLFERIKDWSYDEVTKRYQKQKDIKSFLFLTRFFYWLFNWNQYAEDGYLLTAYFEVHNLENMEKKMGEWLSSNKKGKERPSLLDQLLNYIGSLRTDNSSSNPNHSFDSHENTDSSFSEESKKSKPISLEDYKLAKQLSVSSSMVADLKTLGLECKQNDFITFIEIRVAYKKKALLVHPDKNPEPEAGANFNNLKNAFERLERSFEAFEPANLSVVPNGFQNLKTQLDELETSFKELRRRLDFIDNDQQAIKEEQQAIKEEQQAIKEEQQVLQSRSDAQLLKLANLRREIEQLQDSRRERVSPFFEKPSWTSVSPEEKNAARAPSI